MSNRIDQMHVGVLTATSFTPPAGSISNAGIASDAAIDASKLKHQYIRSVGDEAGATASDKEILVHVAYAAGTVEAVAAFAVTPNTSTNTVSVDVKKNGVSILTAAISLDSADAAYTPVVGTIDTATLAAGDVLTAEIDQSSGSGDAEGVGVRVVIREAAE